MTAIGNHWPSTTAPAASANAPVPALAATILFSSLSATPPADACANPFNVPRADGSTSRLASVNATGSAALPVCIRIRTPASVFTRATETAGHPHHVCSRVVQVRSNWHPLLWEAADLAIRSVPLDFTSTRSVFARNYDHHPSIYPPLLWYNEPE